LGSDCVFGPEILIYWGRGAILKTENIGVLMKLRRKMKNKKNISKILIFKIQKRFEYNLLIPLSVTKQYLALLNNIQSSCKYVDPSRVSNSQSPS
jgi:hypothetical protein